jgi:hypothetical protein
MKTLLQGIKKLARWQQLTIVVMLLIVLLTWLAVCVILGSYLVS